MNVATDFGACLFAQARQQASHRVKTSDAPARIAAVGAVFASHINEFDDNRSKGERAAAALLLSTHEN
jgi:hypothetical protein